MEEIREYREGSQLTFIKNKLVDVIIKKNEMPIFNSIDIFNDLNALQKSGAE